MRQGNHRRWPQVAAGHGDLSGRVQLQPGTGKYKHVTDFSLIQHETESVLFLLCPGPAYSPPNATLR